MSPSPHDAPRTFAVISAFNPPPDLVDRATSLLGEVDHIVVVDDGSGTADALGLPTTGVDVISLQENAGIAYALNVGIAWAVAAGATHVLTLDQDSEVPDGYVVLAHDLIRAKESAGIRVAAVVPETVEGELITTIGDGDRPLDPIQSGQLIPVEVFAAVGGFASRLVIDAVDSEFTLRARAGGFEFFTVPGSVLGHSLGELTPLTFRGRHLTLLGRRRYWRYHAPFRTYYMVRNGLALWRLHRRGNLRWLLWRTAYLIVDIACTSAISADRGAQLLAVGRGLVDVCRGRLGPIPPRLRTVLGRMASAPQRTAARE